MQVTIELQLLSAPKTLISTNITKLTSSTESSQEMEVKHQMRALQEIQKILEEWWEMFLIKRAICTKKFKKYIKKLTRTLTSGDEEKKCVKE